MPALRKCNVCALEFELTSEFFHRQPKNEFGLSETCKQCANTRARKWHQDNLERARETSDTYRARTRFPGSRKAEKEKHRDQILGYMRGYYKKNAERIKKTVREYQAANQQTIAERKRLAYAANRQANRARSREWAAANPEKYKANAVRMRARRRGAPGRFTASDITAQYERQHGTCFYCPQSLAHGNFQVDHYIPIVRGGDNDPSNIVLACPSCNRAKGRKLPWNFKVPKDF